MNLSHALHSHPLRPGTGRGPCESEVMTITGERPSPMGTWNHWEPEGDCAAERRGGKQPEGSSQAQSGPAKGHEPDTAGGRGRVCVAKTKPGAEASCAPTTSHVSELSARPPNVPGVSMRKRRRHSRRNETRAGARRERCGSQSRHNSDGARESRVSQGR